MDTRVLTLVNVSFLPLLSSFFLLQTARIDLGEAAVAGGSKVIFVAVWTDARRAGSTQATCIDQAARVYGAAPVKRQRSTVISGAWDHLPTGCSVRAAGDW